MQSNRLFFVVIFSTLLYANCANNELDSFTVTISNDDYLQFPELCYNQSMDFYEDKAFFISNRGDNLVCNIYDLNTYKHKGRLMLPYGNYCIPHANAASFGKQRYTSSSSFPVLYVSSWNYDRQAFVYDIINNSGIYLASLIQVIDPSFLNEDIIGKGYLDWVVDTEGGFLYSLAYHIKGTSTQSEGNYTHVTKFLLPSLNEEYIKLEDKDIIDSFTIPVITVFQDKCFKDNHIYVVAGMPDDNDSYPPRLFDIDIESRKMIEYSLSFDGEPEGLCYYKGHKWVNYYKSNLVLNADKLIN